MSRPPKPEIEALLDELSRSTDPSAEALAQLQYELETSPVARKAFTIRWKAMVGFVDHARNVRERLPNKLRERLDTELPRVKTFSELVTEAERKGEEPPQKELELYPTRMLTASESSGCP